MSTYNNLSSREWMILGGTLTVIGGLTYWKMLRSSMNRVNPNIQKDCPKVVHGFDIEDLGESTAFCRCWRSSKFPYCDGSHTAHNAATGDNVGPLCLKRRNNKSN